MWMAANDRFADRARLLAVFLHPALPYMGTCLPKLKGQQRASAWRTTSNHPCKVVARMAGWRISRVEDPMECWPHRRLSMGWTASGTAGGSESSFD
jgi:hypothetical protein